jgi:hypothetical protein
MTEHGEFVVNELDVDALISRQQMILAMHKDGQLNTSDAIHLFIETANPKTLRAERKTRTSHKGHGDVTEQIGTLFFKLAPNIHANSLKQKPIE